MSNENRQILPLPNFIGGWNTRDPNHEIADNQLATGSQNVRIQVGETSIRYGYAVVGDPTGADSCNLIYDGLNHILIVWSDGDLQRLSGTTYTNISTGTFANVLLDAASFQDTSGNNLDILVDGTVVKKWDGSALADLGGSPPTGDMIEIFRNHVWIADGTDLRFSAQEDPETWPATNKIRPKLGDTIKGIKAYGLDRLIVFRSKAIDHIVGFDVLSFERIEASTGVGCASNKSIVVVQNSPNPRWNGLYWVDLGGIYFSEDLGVTPIRISDPIQPTFDAYNQTALNKCVAENLRSEDQVLFSLRSNGSGSPAYNDRVLAWNYKLGIWDPEYVGMRFSAFGEVDVSSTFKLYAGESKATPEREVYAVTEATNDNGTAISFKAKTKALDMSGVYERSDILRKLSILNDALAQDLTVNVYYNLSSTADSTDSGAKSMENNATEFWYDTVANAAQFELVQETKDVATSIRRLAVEFDPGELD